MHTRHPFFSIHNVPSFWFVGYQLNLKGPEDAFSMQIYYIGMLFRIPRRIPAQDDTRSGGRNVLTRTHTHTHTHVPFVGADAIAVSDVAIIVAAISYSCSGIEIHHRTIP